MTLALLIAIAVGCFLLGMAVWYMVTSHKQARMASTIGFLEQKTSDYDQIRHEREQLQIQRAELLKERDADAEKLRWLESAQQQLGDAFDALASKALRMNSEQFMTRSREQLEGFVKDLETDWATRREQLNNMVEPLGKNLTRLDDQIHQIEEKRQGAYENLMQQVSDLSRAHQELQTATTTLTQALKSSKVRGKWGEVQLRRIVEMAGMVDHVDFEEQVMGRDGVRPDMIVHLPHEGIIPVDAKAPMDAYMSTLEADTEEVARKRMNEHVTALRQHVKSLAQKAYWSQFPVAPEFVVMLIPYESGLSAAFDADPKLLDTALSNKVVIVSPATLLALLKVVSYGWMQLEIARNAHAIAEQGKELSTRFRTFIDHFSSVGSSLNASMENYNKAVGSLESRVVPSLRKLREMGAASEDPADLKQIENQTRTVNRELD